MERMGKKLENDFKPTCSCGTSSLKREVLTYYQL
jgi:hypothetical protein